ncbi:MAG: hypothetical protein ACR9NN_18050 [Nostochopsis sp.]
MSELIYPTLDLFIYDLRDGLGDNNADVAANQEYFLRRFPERLHPLLKQRDAIEAEYVELLGNRGRETFDSSTTQYSLKGWYYPVHLGDSYGLLLDCSVEHSLRNVQQGKNEALPISCFGDLKAEIENRLANTHSTIGQVWMLSGQLSNFTPDQAEIIAKECSKVSARSLNVNLDFRGKSPFFGGMLFEFYNYRLHIPSELQNSLNIQDIQDNHYVIIAIYPDAKTARKAAEFNFDWLRLFAYRSKILWAYGQSQYLKNKLRDDFVAIQQYQKDFNKAKSGKLDLNKLRQTLVNAQETLWRYSVNLNYLATQKRTIEINLLNYERRLAIIQQKLNTEQDYVDLDSLQQLIEKQLETIKQKITNLQTPSNLEFIHKFIEEIRLKYLEQVKNDYESLNIGMTLLTDLINAIRGVTEIGSSERDRTFQSTIAIVGVGLAGSSFVASIAGQFPGTTNPQEAAKYPVGSLVSSLGVPEPWLSPAVSATVSLGVGILAAFVTWLGIKVFESLRK